MSEKIFLSQYEDSLDWREVGVLEINIDAAAVVRQSSTPLP